MFKINKCLSMKQGTSPYTKYKETCLKNEAPLLTLGIKRYT